jgi:hypothetical protein
MAKEQLLFFCKFEDDELTVNTKENIDADIKLAENMNEDIKFEVIGNVPRNRVNADMPSNIITWYQPDTITKILLDRAVLAAIQYTMNYGQ